jgi:hypothetical protein
MTPPQPMIKPLIKLTFKDDSQDMTKKYTVYITGSSIEERQTHLKYVKEKINGFKLSYKVYDEDEKLKEHEYRGDNKKRRAPQYTERAINHDKEMKHHLIKTQDDVKRKTVKMIIDYVPTFSLNSLRGFNDQLKKFKKSLGIVSKSSSKCYYPKRLPKTVKWFRVTNEPELKYPVFIVSKGRNLSSHKYTWDLLEEIGVVDYKVVVEPSNYWLNKNRFKEYEDRFKEKLMVVPMDRMKQIEQYNKEKDPIDHIGNSVIQRSYIVDYCNDMNIMRHWDLDDNISNFTFQSRLSVVPIRSKLPLKYIEDLSDYYEFSMGGFIESGKGSPCRDMKREKNTVGSRVFSCMLIDNMKLKEKGLNFIGHLNEDLILNLQVLYSGLGVFRTNQFRIVKPSTSNSKKKKCMEGGNTDLHGVVEENGKTGIENRLTYAIEKINSMTKEKIIKSCKKNKKSYDSHFNVDYNNMVLRKYEKEILPKIIEEKNPPKYYEEYEIIGVHN